MASGPLARCSKKPNVGGLSNSNTINAQAVISLSRCTKHNDRFPFTNRSSRSIRGHPSSAFKEDRESNHQEALDDRLQKLVEDGKITQAQANEYKAWLEAKPDDIPPVRPGMLEKLVEEGKITQAQADEFTKWLESKPDMPMPKIDRFKRGPRRSF